MAMIWSWAHGRPWNLGSAEKCENMGLLSSQDAQRNSITSSVTTLGGTPDRTPSFYANDGVDGTETIVSKK